MTEGNPVETTATWTQCQGQASSGLARIREAARREPSLRFTCLMHHVTVDLLRDAYFALRRNAAPGLDGVTWAAYGDGLEARLADLHDRVHSGRYRARPCKRVWIPKPDGRQRPLGIAVLEDKVVQQAMAWVLGQIYEQDFLGFSYGFRPGRGPHDALDALWVALTERKVNWVLDADIRSFFDIGPPRSPNRARGFVRSCRASTTTTPCPATAGRWRPFARWSARRGFVPCAAAARKACGWSGAASSA